MKKLLIFCLLSLLLLSSCATADPPSKELNTSGPGTAADDTLPETPGTTAETEKPAETAAPGTEKTAPETGTPAAPETVPATEPVKETEPAPETDPPIPDDEPVWTVGYGSREIAIPEKTDEPLYIAGYHQGWEIGGVSDLQRANAVWLDGGEGGILMIGIDCVGLSSDVVNEIRSRLSDLVKESGCVSVNVYATHTHAGIDTLGLWGPTGIDGKNKDFMANLKTAAVEAAKEAYENRAEGRLYYGSVDTGDLQKDSRKPKCFDPNLYQLRFQPKEEGNGVRLFFYAAHAESMRGDNKLVSRDYPGVLIDTVEEKTGDKGIFFPGAIGGLIMTEAQIPEPFSGNDAVKNRDLTGKRLAEYALSIDNETVVAPSAAVSTVKFEVPLENIVFQYYKFLGILGSEIKGGDPNGEYFMVSELSVIKIGKLAVGLIPAELTPELALGGGVLKKMDPEPLNDIAAKAGFDKLLLVGLCNDEMGYVIPPSQFLLNPEAPYIDRIKDETGEDHYEETNSVGPEIANAIAEAFRKAIGA